MNDSKSPGNPKQMPTHSKTRQIDNPDAFSYPAVEFDHHQSGSWKMGV
ncbi:conserved hypothetical protein [delta proteobacterium NaphS2]|nr:conserved hypothetical protein [delta proteobacterium NaphS2]